MAQAGIACDVRPPRRVADSAPRRWDMRQSRIGGNTPPRASARRSRRGRCAARVARAAHPARQRALARRRDPKSPCVIATSASASRGAKERSIETGRRSPRIAAHRVVQTQLPQHFAQMEMRHRRARILARRAPKAGNRIGRPALVLVRAASREPLCKGVGGHHFRRARSARQAVGGRRVAPGDRVRRAAAPAVARKLGAAPGWPGRKPRRITRHSATAGIERLQRGPGRGIRDCRARSARTLPAPSAPMRRAA